MSSGETQKRVKRTSNSDRRTSSGLRKNVEYLSRRIGELEGGKTTRDDVRGIFALEIDATIDKLIAERNNPASRGH